MSKLQLRKKERGWRKSAKPRDWRRKESNERPRGKLNWRGCVASSFILKSKRENVKNKRGRRLRRGENNKKNWTDREGREKRPRGKGERRKKQRRSDRLKKGLALKNREGRNRRNTLDC